MSATSSKRRVWCSRERSFGSFLIPVCSWSNFQVLSIFFLLPGTPNFHWGAAEDSYYCFSTADCSLFSSKEKIRDSWQIQPGSRVRGSTPRATEHLWGGRMCFSGTPPPLTHWERWYVHDTFTLTSDRVKSQARKDCHPYIAWGVQFQFSTTFGDISSYSSVFIRRTLYPLVTHCNFVISRRPN